MRNQHFRWIILLSIITVIAFGFSTASAAQRTPDDDTQVNENDDIPLDDYLPILMLGLGVLGVAIWLRGLFSGSGLPSKFEVSGNYEDLSLDAHSEDPPAAGGKKGQIWVKRTLKLSASPWELMALKWSANGYDAPGSTALVVEVANMIHQQRRKKVSPLSDTALHELDEFAHSLRSLMSHEHTSALKLNTQIQQIRAAVTFDVYYCTAPGTWEKLFSKDFTFAPYYEHITPVRPLAFNDEAIIHETVRVIDQTVSELARWPWQAH